MTVKFDKKWKEMHDFVKRTSMKTIFALFCISYFMFSVQAHASPYVDGLKETRDLELYKARSGSSVELPDWHIDVYVTRRLELIQEQINKSNNKDEIYHLNAIRNLYKEHYRMPFET